MQIITDSREQLRLWDATLVKKLVVGDYTTKKLESSFIVERKSPADLYQTVLQGHVRFRKELMRAAEHQIQLVMYVECPVATFYAKAFPGGSARQCSGDTLRKIIYTISTRYNLEFNWARDRDHMKQLMLSRFRQEEKYRR